MKIDVELNVANIDVASLLAVILVVGAVVTPWVVPLIGSRNGMQSGHVITLGLATAALEIAGALKFFNQIEPNVVASLIVGIVAFGLGQATKDLLRLLPGFPSPADTPKPPT